MERVYLVIYDVRNLLYTKMVRACSKEEAAQGLPDESRVWRVHSLCYEGEYLLG